VAAPGRRDSVAFSNGASGVALDTVAPLANPLCSCWPCLWVASGKGSYSLFVKNPYEQLITGKYENIGEFASEADSANHRKTNSWQSRDSRASRTGPETSPMCGAADGKIGYL
jgi:hypothetical protein